MNLSIVIPNYNGHKLLKKYLPSVVNFSFGAEIIVVDDASSDQSVSWLRQHYPGIRVLSNPVNIGFAASVNRGVQVAKGDLILLLNNDVSLNAHTIKHLLKPFTDPQVFAVGSLEKLPGGKTRGKSKGSFKRGLFIHQASATKKYGPTLWVFAASGMYRKSIWAKLGGLDTLFHPAYYEDIDICYRAWKLGFKSLFCPSSTVKHQAESTMNHTLGANKSALVFKNQLLFIWKNITDPNLLFQHLLWLPYHLTITNFKTGGSFSQGFLRALYQLPQLLRSRSSPSFHLSDAQVFQLFAISTSASIQS